MARITAHSLGRLEWKLAGFVPHMWRSVAGMETGAPATAEVTGLTAAVPGSVQKTLLDAGLLPDWNHGLNARACEWVENRHWVYTARLPDDWFQPGKTVTLRCLGLDYCGVVRVNGKEAGTFANSFVPHSFDLTALVREKDNILQIAFECPPRALGQIGFTSRITEWKPRFNYFWDWTQRLVQIGIWDDLELEISDGPLPRLEQLYSGLGSPSGPGSLFLRGDAAAAAKVKLVLNHAGHPVAERDLSPEQFAAGFEWTGLQVRPWQPNGRGEPVCYEVAVSFRDANGNPLHALRRPTGFKHVRWIPNQDAPAGADPWVCVVNGMPLFLVGVNWTPIRPNFADVSETDYRERLETYRDLGFNLLRVWGGAFLEKECFYRLCDELGLMVWQEFPLSSSGLDNWPPEDPTAIEQMGQIATSYVERRQHHVSLLLWCGGNELMGDPRTAPQFSDKPVDESHPMIGRIATVVRRLDPLRRFLPASSSGPKFYGDEDKMGTGIHWDVHGPWIVTGSVQKEWKSYWDKDDALFRSEAGAPGASPAALIRQYRGACDDFPADISNPYWRRSYWWIEWDSFTRENGRPAADLAEYVRWSQQRQADALTIALRRCLDRFPACGGILFWMGHDSFPCTANTAILDFHGHPKPAALALKTLLVPTSK